MKQYFFCAALIVGFLTADAQRKPACPPGYDHVGEGITIDKFNFHKPRTDCHKGFGICMEVTPYLLCDKVR
jgi:hypothetical protein